VKLWDTRTGTVLHNLIGSKALVQDVAFSPDGSRLVTGGTKTTVWDARTGTTLFDLKGRPGTVSSVVFSPDGTRIVTGGYTGDNPYEAKGEATVWDAQTGTALFDLTGHAKWVYQAEFTPDGTRIVTRGLDGTAKVWNALTGKALLNEPIPITLEKSRVSPDGQLLARVDGDRVELISLKLGAEELAYRRMRMEPNPSRYRAAYLAARAAQDDFAARFYLKLIPSDERKGLLAEAEAGASPPLKKK
jgi:WD40 repeat protein